MPPLHAEAFFLQLFKTEMISITSNDLKASPKGVHFDSRSHHGFY